MLFLTSCADIIDIYFYSNPDEKGLLNKLWGWLQFNTNPIFQFLFLPVLGIIGYLISLFFKKDNGEKK